MFALAMTVVFAAACHPDKITQVVAVNTGSTGNPPGGTVVDSTLTLNTGDRTMPVGTTFQVVAMINNTAVSNTSVTWTSSNNAVVTVVNGLITAVAPGTAQVCAAVGSKKVCITITVISGQPSGGLTVNPNPINLNLCGSGFTGTTTATIVLYSNGVAVPASETVFEQAGQLLSINPTTALATPANVGSSYVRVSAKSAPTQYVQVPITVTSVGCQPIVAVNGGSQTISVPGIGCANTSWPLPAGTWVSSNPSIVVISSTGLVTGLQSGTARIDGATAAGVATFYTITVTNQPCSGGNTLTLTITPSTYTGQKGGAFQFQAGGSAVQFGVQWYSTDPSRVAVNQQTGAIALVFTGQANVCVQSKVNLGLVACATVTVQ